MELFEIVKTPEGWEVRITFWGTMLIVLIASLLSL